MSRIWKDVDGRQPKTAVGEKEREGKRVKLLPLLLLVRIITTIKLQWKLSEDNNKTLEAP